MENLNFIIAKNICEYRKKCNLTQSELANLLNFSDKSVSKWERGESIPDINVLMEMCKIFGININDLTSEHKTYKLTSFFKRNRILIPIISAGLVWLVATIIFVSLLLFAPNVSKKWLCFIFAIPLSSIILLIFSWIWGKRWMRLLFESIITWTTLLCICLSVSKNVWYLMLIGIPVQVLAVLWYFMRRKKDTKVINYTEQQ